MEFIKMLTNPGVILAIVIAILVILSIIQFVRLAVRKSERMSRYPGGLTTGASRIMMDNIRGDPLVSEHMSASSFEHLEDKREYPELINMLY